MRQYTAKFPAQEQTVGIIARLQQVEGSIASRDGACVVDLAADLGTSEKQVRRYLAILRELGCKISTKSGVNERAYWRCAKSSRVFR